MQESNRNLSNEQENESDATSTETVSDLEENTDDVKSDSADSGPSPDGAFDDSEEIKDADPF